MRAMSTTEVAVVVPGSATWWLERQARATRRWVLFYVVLLATCLALVALSGAGPIQEVRRGFVFAVSPIQGSLSSAARTVTSIVTAVGDIDQLRRDNAALTDRVSTLETQLQELAVLKAENERLSKTLGVQATVPGQTVAADVVAREATPQERVLTIAPHWRSAEEAADKLKASIAGREL